MNIEIDFIPYYPTAVEIELFYILLHKTNYGVLLK